MLQCDKYFKVPLFKQMVFPIAVYFILLTKTVQSLLWFRLFSLDHSIVEHIWPQMAPSLTVSLLELLSCVAALCSPHWEVTKRCLTSFTGNFLFPRVTWLLFPLVLLQRSCLRAVKCSRYAERGTNMSFLWWLCMAGMGNNSYLVSDLLPKNTHHQMTVIDIDSCHQQKAA